jgi:TonB-dependent starch-binding outer membrane protein SusC
MNRFRWLFVIAFAVAAFPAWATAQERGTVVGTVVDAATMQPIVGAQITVVGTQLGTLTNQQGRFVIPNVAAGAREIRAIRIGFSEGRQAVTVAPGETVTIDFQLREMAVPLEGIVATAPGMQERRRAIGNAIESLRIDDMDLGPVTNMQELLTARASNVQVVHSGGTAGTGSRVRIRGLHSASLTNEPLIVIDGIRMTGQGDQYTQGASSGQAASRLNDLNAQDIENIEIIKGPAAAALYGTAAANGVIMITTRRGAAGPARWSAYTEMGVVQEHNSYPTAYHANGTVTATGAATQNCTIFSQAAGTCTINEIVGFNVLEDSRTRPFRDGFRQKYGLSVSGGVENTSYYFSGDWESEEGVLEWNEVDRANVRANVRAQLSPNFTLSANSGFMRNNLLIPQNDNNAFGVMINGLMRNRVPFDAVQPDEIWRVGLSPQRVHAREERQQVDRFIGSMTADWRPRDWMTFTSTGGLDLINQHDNTFSPPGAYLGVIFGSPHAEGFRASHRNQTWNWTWNNTLTAIYDITPGLVGTTNVGTSFHTTRHERTYAFGAGLLGGANSLNAASSLFSVTETNREIVTVGALARQQLAWQDRLFVAASIRGDDNSAFGTEFGLALYPAVSASWVMSDEAFFPELDFLNTVRLRAAWGRSGLFPAFRQADTWFSPVAVQVEGAELAAITVGGTGNPDLEPETSQEFELGFDIGLLQDRLSLEGTWYNKTSKNALVNAVLAPSLGLGARQMRNIGAVQNTGFETTVNARVLTTGPVTGGVRLTASWNTNELTDLGGEESIIFGLGGDTQRHVEGYPLGGFWHPRITEWADTNGDGIIDFVDVTRGADGLPEAVYHGPAFPTRNISVGFDVNMLGWIRASALFEHRGGNIIYNGTDFFLCGTSVGNMRCLEGFDPAAGTPERQAAILASLQGLTRAGMFEKADFTRFRELSVTFTAPDQVVRTLPGARGASLTVAGRNLALWTDYTGTDPELNFGGQNSDFWMADFFTQPPIRHWMARIDLNF